ncbi:MAG: DUF86 domain-containing protein [Coleofasciculaceae cyanobacterium]
MSRDNQTLLDLARSARLIIEFQQGIDKAALATDIKTQSAMLYHFLILGEAVKRLSPEFRLQHPEIPWSSIAGMRDRLIHDYDEIDLEQVWDTSQTDVPIFLAMIEPLLPVEEE